MLVARNGIAPGLSVHWPYTLPEYTKDVRKWVRATHTAPERMGPLGIGGAARLVVDELDPEVLAADADANLNDGRGRRFCNGLELLFHLLNLI